VKIDALSMLSSETNCGKYVTFDEDINTEISKFLGIFLNIATFSRTGQSVCKVNICEHRNFGKIERFQKYFSNKAIEDKMHSLKSRLGKDGVTCLIEELAKYDFALHKNLLSKVKIFHRQSN
jgi:hypothetical protein